MRTKGQGASGGSANFWKGHSIKDGHSQVGNPTASNEKRLPSESAHVSPEKAKTILKDGSVRGHPLTPAQKGMFGAIAGKGRKKK